MGSELLHLKWQDYLFLTVEMRKFLRKSDLKMFFTLVDQREEVQLELEKTTNKAYHSSPEGKKLLLQVQQANQELMNEFNLVFNTIKNRKNISQAYDGVPSSIAGSFINHKT